MEGSPEQFRYTEEAALEEAEKMKEKVSSGEAKSYEEADWLADKERFAALNTLEVEIGGDFQKVLEAINNDLGISLQSREEHFHVTIISPTERKILETVDEKQLETLRNIRRELRYGVGIKISGIGMIDGAARENIRAADKEKKTCFATFEIPALQQFREKLGLPQKDFHATLGFVGGDIHMEIAGKDAKGKDILKSIEKKADPAFDKYLSELPHVFSSRFFSGQEKQKSTKEK